MVLLLVRVVFLLIAEMKLRNRLRRGEKKRKSGRIKILTRFLPLNEERPKVD